MTRTALPSTTRPTARRRTAVAITTLLASALPLVWGAGALGMLLTGYESDHRFHQVTGQGVLLAVLWLAGPLGLAAAGWRGRRPPAPAALAHLAFVAATVTAAAFVPGEGVRAVAVIVTVTGALLWAALPRRPRLTGLRPALHPLRTPVALLAAALYTPFVLAQRTLQDGSHDEHAAMTHYFDMAWVSLALVALFLVAGLVPAARRLGVLAAAGTLVVGASRMLITGEVTWSATALALGLAGLAAAALPRTREARPETAAAGVRAA